MRRRATVATHDESRQRVALDGDYRLVRAVRLKTYVDDSRGLPTADSASERPCELPYRGHALLVAGRDLVLAKNRGPPRRAWQHIA